MSLASPYQEHYYVADGVTTSFSFGEYFTGLSQAYVKSIIYFDDGTNCVPTFTVDMTTGFITIVTLTKPDGTVLTVPPAGSIVRVFRDTPEQQNVTASQLQNYTAKQLERIFDSVVAMIQEVSYSDLHKTIRLTETQRDVSMEQLKEENDQAILYWDFETRQLKATDYGQNQVVKSDTVDRLVYLQPEGKIYFIPKGSNNPIAIGSATIHNDLSGRNAPDCHPESAITGLREHLQELRDKDIEIEEDVQIALNRSQEAKDTADEAKEIAQYAQNIAEEAKDIAEDAKDVAEGIDEKAQTALDNSEEALDKVTQEITDRQGADDALQDQITDNKDTIEDHIANTNNPHQVTKAQVGLGNVDNTSDLDKPISTATQSALDLKMPISTKYGASLSLTIDSSTYVVTAQLKDQDGNNLGSAQTIDLPLESVVVNGSYDNVTKSLILTLENGNTITIPIADLISGLQEEITVDNKLDADLVDDSTSTNKFVTSSDITTWNAKQDALTAGSNITISGTTISATDTTYTGSDGITLTGTNFTNSGVRSVSTGSTNGTISVNTNGTSADVAVYGLGSAAYTASTSYATSAQGALADTAVQPGDLATVATTGSYNDLSDKPTIGNATLTIQKNSTTIDTFTANATSNKTINIAVPTKTSDITNDSDYQNGTQVATAISTHNTSVTAHSNQFNAITEKIPAEASSSNKLADKAFVNSSIATNTANFIGTFNSVAELEAYSGTVTNNDYAFVIVTDSAGNTAYDRYKYTTATTPASWIFEYELNNSSFTATQWAAINSGANTTNIGQIATNTTTISNHIGNTSNPHQVTKTQVGLGNVDNTSDLAKPISTATQTALDTKADKTNLINGAPLSNSSSNFFGVSSTAAATVQKEVSIPSITSLEAGIVIIVQPTVTSTVANSTLKLNSFDAYPMRYNNAAITTSTDSIVWNAAYPSVWVFDGTYWRFVAHGIDSNTTYSTMSVAEGTTGTATSNRVLQAVNLKQIIQGTTLTGIDVATTGAVSASDTITDGIGKLQATKANTADLATVATSGSYNDLSDKPTIPAAQVNSDWNAVSGVAQILNKPTLATVATSGSYNDLSDKPTIPTVNNATLTIQKNGTTVQTFTANQSTNATANISVPTKTSDITNDSGFITSSALAPYALSADLATVATSGDYNDLSNKPTIPTVGNGTITITQGGISKGTFTTNQSGNTTIALDAGGGGIGNIDNITITANASDEIQAVATVNANIATGATNPIYDWVGTLAEYQAQNIETLHPDWVCYITDDFSAQAYDAYSKGQTNSLLADKVDVGHQVIEFQEPNAGNNYTWYRKYADGWVEQGGYRTDAPVTITLPIPMADTNYTATKSINTNYDGNTNSVTWSSSIIIKVSTTQIKLCQTSGGPAQSWRVEGMYAQS